MKSESTAKHDKLRTQSVWKLLLVMGIPMILSMMLQALYNIVDSAFVSNMPGGQGDAAFTALTIAFPVQMLIIAISIGTGVGVNVLLSRYLGEGDREKASQTAGNGVFLAACIYIVFLLFGLFGANLYVSSQTTNAEVRDMAVGYLKICCIFSFGNSFFAIYEKLLQATGRSTFSTTGQIVGAVANIILDPIFIYEKGYGIGLFGLGVEGAAWATIIGQILSFLLDMVFHFVFNKEVSNNIKYLKPSGRLIGRIYAIGLPAIIAQALMSVMTYGMNIILGGVDRHFYPDGEISPYVNAYGLYYKIQQFILFAAFGLRDAITPIVSYAYGMGSKQRVRDGIKYGMLYTAVVMIVGTVLLETCASPLQNVFGGLSGEAQELCIGAMRIISISFLFAGACVALQGVFQATGGNLQSLVISVLRQAILVLPIAYGFACIVKAGTAGGRLIWCTFIIAEFVTAIVGFILLWLLYKKRISCLKEKCEEAAAQADIAKCIQPEQVCETTPAAVQEDAVPVEADNTENSDQAHS